MATPITNKLRVLRTPRTWSKVPVKHMCYAPLLLMTPPIYVDKLRATPADPLPVFKTH